MGGIAIIISVNSGKSSHLHVQQRNSVRCWKIHSLVGTSGGLGKRRGGGQGEFKSLTALKCCEALFIVSKTLLRLLPRRHPIVCFDYFCYFVIFLSLNLQSSIINEGIDCYIINGCSGLTRTVRRYYKLCMTYFILLTNLCF